MTGIESIPLRPRAKRSSDTLFEKLNPKSVGIGFNHKWSPPEKYRVMIAREFAGSGTATGDIDGDGLPDLYLARAQGGGRLYRSLGDLKFEDVTTASGLESDRSWASGCSFVDIDGDSDLDLYVCGFDCPNRLYVNDGSGHFHEAANEFGLDFVGASVMMSFADYDNDGDMDGFLVTNRHAIEGQRVTGAAEANRVAKLLRRSGDRVVVPPQIQELYGVLYKGPDKAVVVKTGQYGRLFQNNGNGKFVDATKRSGVIDNGLSLSATWWDFNSDSLPDLYIANDFYGPDRLYKNNGDGTFTDVIGDVLPHTPWFSMSSDLGDINNDGRIDFIATDMSGSTHYKSKVGMGDMSSDAWFLETGTPRQYMRNAVYLNTGVQRFMEVAHITGLSNSDWTWAPRFSDFDNDGYLDVFITNGMSGDWANSDLALNTVDVKVRDVLDRIPRKLDHNMAFRNGGNLSFDNVGDEWGLSENGVSFGCSTGDFDGDGDLDLVVNNFDGPPSIYRNQSSDGNVVRVALQGSESNRNGVGAYVKLTTPDGKTQVRYMTLARGFMSSSEPVLHFGLGEHAEFGLSVQWPSGNSQTFSSLEANQFYTVTESAGEKAGPPAKTLSPQFVRSSRTDSITHREQKYDDFQVQPLLPNKQSQWGPGIACGDVNNDGIDDLYICGAAGQTGQMAVSKDGQLRVNADLQIPFDSFKTSEELGAIFFEADGDGDVDLFVVSGGVEAEPESEQLRDRLFLNDGMGRFTYAPNANPDIRRSGSCVAACDFDRDGDLDLFVGGRTVPGEYPLSEESYLLVNDDGRFRDATDSTAAAVSNLGIVTSAIWSDADGDGWIDLLVTQEWGSVRLIKNDRGRLIDVDDARNLTEPGWWNGIAAGDFDNDGDIDYAVSNFGLNIKYHVSANHPAILYYGDFDGSGTSHLVEAKDGHDGLLPVRGKSCSQNAMPFIRAKLPHYHDFASATLEEIYSPGRVDSAMRKTATLLQSGVLLNQGNATFEFHELPRFAQISPSFGVVATDFDGDGNCDIVMAQNFFGPQRETGRMDGGLGIFLKGNGNGQFAPVWPAESGIQIHQDAKSIAVTDINGDLWPDFVTGINDGNLIAYENIKVAGRRMLRIRLQGSSTNPSGVGARIQLQTRDGASQISEVYAGGSYLAQSSSVISFGLPAKKELRKITVRWPDGSQRTITPNGTSGADIVIRKRDWSAKERHRAVKAKFVCRET